MTDRIFISRLTGTAVFDPQGDQLGKVRDTLVHLRHSNNPPRIIGLLVEVPQRRIVFLPISRVNEFESRQIITTGVVNMRRFEQRESESRVVGQLLDRKMKMKKTGEEVTLLDIAMEQSRPGADWHITKIYLKRASTRFGRRGEKFFADWSEVEGLTLQESSQQIDNALVSINDMIAPDIATYIADFELNKQVEVLSKLDDERLADVLEEMSEETRVAIVEKLEIERAADVIEEMAPDDAADLLKELPPQKAEEYLELMEPEEADDLRRLLTYGDYTAGGMMTTEPIVLPPDATVAEALANVRNPELPPSLASQVYVVRPPLDTPTGKYLGVAHMQRLLREAPGTLVSSVIDTELKPVEPNTSLALVTRYFATYNLVALPVVDSENRLLGAVTVDDVIDHMLPDDWRDQDAIEVNR
ncbi:MAG: magnesium transporter MgtE N-terminal domain-containing protein [Candidatus Nanopelagicales bacterium]